MRWPPCYEKVVLSEGDPSAVHVGGAPGKPEPAAEPAGGAVEPGQKWLAWLHDNGIEWESPAA